MSLFRLIFFFSLFFFSIPFSVFTLSMEDENSVNPEGNTREKSKPKVGYNLAPFPEFRVDPVVGIYLGINATLFDYGTGEKYPDYKQFFNLNLAHGTKGKTNLSLRYKRYGNLNYSGKMGYSLSQLYPFYGYNGYQTQYNQAFEDPNSNVFNTSAFYYYQQSRSHFEFQLQDQFGLSDFKWNLGFNLAYYQINRVDFDQLNKNNKPNGIYVDAPTLYDKYIEWQLIAEEEKEGGWANSIQAGLSYDTRDRLTNPMKGTWVETTLRFSPEQAGNPTTALQLSIKHHQFFTLLPDRVSFAYRLRYDASFGNLPFYTRQVLADGIEGYGGAFGVVGEGFGTIWGILQNRAVGRKMALSNFELRARLFEFRFLNQNWHISLVPIFHTGLILEPYPIDFSSVTASDREKYFRDSYQGWYSAGGIGGKLVMNENIVIGIDYAAPLNQEAGNQSVYVGFGYTF